MSKSWKSGKSYPNVSPSPKAIAKIKARLKELTPRANTLIPLEDIVGKMNASLRGWVNYFHFRNSTSAMTKVKTYAEERLRTHLRKRHKIKDWGTGLKKFPRQKLYGSHGLYVVPTKAAW